MSAIYEGTLKHTRTKPKKHVFEYQVRLLYLDLDDLKNILVCLRTRLRGRLDSRIFQAGISSKSQT